MIRKLTILTLICTCFCALALAQAPVANFTASPVAGCSPLVVSFKDASTGNPTSWFWDFGNGATSTLQNPSTTFFIAGNYNVTLTVTNAAGSNTVSRASFITVYGKPIIMFKANDSVGCYPFPVSITDLSQASPGTTNTNWLWDLGDGAQSAQQNPQNTYLNTGNYTVSVKVTNDKGCWSVGTKQAYIKIDGGVKAAFDFFQPIACRTPLTINFTNSSTGPGVISYQWDFGDGGTSGLSNPVHIYNAPGTYTVRLIAISSNGCRDTLTKTNLFNLKDITTSFTAPTTICVNAPVNLLNTSSSPATTTNWSFGDGTQSTETNPVKYYTVPGTYRIKLLQTYGICADSTFASITVLPKPTAGFTADKTAYCQTPFTVNFQSTSVAAATYLWQFGDGNTSTQQNQSHTYTNYGSYDVSLIVTNTLGCSDTLKKSAYINVNKPVISFASLPQDGCVPYTVNFVANITTPDAVAGYLWDFGNGVTSTQVSPAYTFINQGSYSVSLTITTISGCTQTYTLQNAVNVGTKPTVNFSALPTTVCAYQDVFFTNLSTGGATDYLWIFGDGGRSTLENPRHNYGDTGVFNVTLIVNNNGCKDSLKMDSLIRIKPPIAQFTYTSTCANKLNFIFRDTSLGATSWLWDFGDGTTSTQRHPTHLFPGYGTYAVKLTVRNDTCFNIKEVLIKIAQGTPDFKAVPTQACKGSVIQFVADTVNAANLINYQWNFGHNGPPAYGMSASTVYTLSGTYSVSLTVTDVNGCVDSTVKQQYIRINGPTAKFLATNGSGCKGLLATFTDQSFDDGISKIVAWNWNLGDGTLLNYSTSTNVQHPYPKAGSYPVTLKVTDAGGCSDSLVLAGAVNTTEIKADFVSEDTLTCPLATVKFVNNSTAITTYSSVWSFGDGTSSTAPNPSMAYTADGVYSVKLSITDAYGCSDSLTKTNYITVKHPIASYTVSDSASSCTPFQVLFTNTSSHYTSFSWDLGGGTSTLISPIQFYNQAGSYITKLVITSPGGCIDSATKTINVYDAGRSYIDYLPLNGCKPLTVQLKAFSPSPMTYIWDFGDGAILNTTDSAASHIYNFFGDFVPKVIMRDNSGCVVPVTGLDTIRIKGATAKFGLNNKLLCDSGWVQFSDSTSFNNPVTSYSWNFGDGTTSTTSSPVHFYGAPGLYNVSLNVLTQNACVDTFRLSYPIKVVASPLVGIGGDSVICIGDGMAHLGLINRSDTSALKWSWKFPNGQSSAVQLPQRQFYTQAGNFIVETIATNSSGCKDTATKNILVNPLPYVTIPSPQTTQLGTPVLLPATYFGGVQSYNWSQPVTLDCPTCPRPMANPKFNTKYTVDFVDSNGCRNRGEVQVIVICNGANVFVPNTFSPNADGSNDVFYVRGKGLNRVKTLRIFNRWGQVVFEKQNFNVNDASVGWNGQYNGAKPKPDVYVYQVEVFCDNSEILKFEGNIALIL